MHPACQPGDHVCCCAQFSPLKPLDLLLAGLGNLDGHVHMVPAHQQTQQRL
jgi:hypothetical protein